MRVVKSARQGVARACGSCIVPGNIAETYMESHLARAFVETFFSFRGRIRRRTFWLGHFAVLALLFGYAAGVTRVFEALELEESTETLLGHFAVWPWLFASAWAWLALEVKRWHDRGRSGVWVLMPFVPIVGPPWAFVECGCLPGTAGDNEYGRDPLTASS